MSYERAHYARRVRIFNYAGDCGPESTALQAAGIEIRRGRPRVALKDEIEEASPMKHTPEHWDALIRHLNDGGCPVLRDHGHEIAPTGLSIEKMPGTNFNRTFSLAQGGTGYEIELILRNNAKRPIDVQGFQIRTPWGLPKVSLLPAPMKSSARYPHYCFPEPGPYYDREFVLNRLFARRKSRMNPGEELEGVLVASSEEMIPVDVPHMARTIATLVIFDSRGNAFSAQFRLLVIRSEHLDRHRAHATANEHDSAKIGDDTCFLSEHGSC